MSFTVADAIGVYTPQDDPDIQKDTTERPEFAELASFPDEKIPAPGEFFNRQILVQRLMSVYPSLILDHEPGTGKSGSYIAVGKYFRSRRLQEGDAAPIQEAWVLVSGPILVNEMKRQIYQLSREQGAEAGTTRKQRNQSLTDFWKVTTYQLFVKNVYVRGTNTLISPQEVAKKFARILLIIDEIHLLRNESKLTGETRAMRDIKALAVRMGLTTSQTALSDAKSADRIYRGLEHVLRYAPGIKFIGGSGTLAYNDREDLARSVNLALPDYLKLKPGFNDDDLKAIGGYISTFRASKDLAKMNYVSNAEFRGRKIYAGVMHEFQLKGYTAAEQKSGPADIRAQQASLMVYPNGEVTDPVDHQDLPKGVEGPWIGKAENEQFYLTRAFKEYIERNGSDFKSKLAQLYTLSISYANLIQIMHDTRAAHAGKPRDKRPVLGTGFIHIHFVNGTGAIMCGLLLEYFLDYEIYDGRQSYLSATAAPVRAGGTETKRPVEMKRSSSFEVTATGRSDTNISTSSRSDDPEDESPEDQDFLPGVSYPVVQPKRRYSLLTGTQSEARRSNILEFFNNAENWDGSYLEFIIGSEVAGVGINLYHGAQYFPMTKDWNDAGAYQALFRLFRATGFDVMKANLIKLGLLKEGESTTVNIYDITSLVSAEDLLAKEPRSIDLRMNIASIQKTEKINSDAKVYRAVAIDAKLNAAANDAATGVSTSIVPPESKGDMKSFDRYAAPLSEGKAIVLASQRSKNTLLEQSLLVSSQAVVKNYNIHYNQRGFRTLRNAVVSFMRTRGSINYWDAKLMANLNGVSEVLVRRVFIDLTSKPEPIVDWMLRSMYVHEDSGVMFLDPAFSGAHLDNQSALQDMRYTRSVDFSVQQSVRRSIRDVKESQRLSSVDMKDLPMMDEKMDFRARAALLEEEIDNRLTAPTVMGDYIRRRYWFWIHEGVTPDQQTFVAHRLLALDLPRDKSFHNSRLLKAFPDMTRIKIGQSDWTLASKSLGSAFKLVEMDLERRLEPLRREPSFATYIGGEYRIVTNTGITDGKKGVMIKSLKDKKFAGADSNGTRVVYIIANENRMTGPTPRIIVRESTSEFAAIPTLEDLVKYPRGIHIATPIVMFRTIMTANDVPGIVRASVASFKGEDIGRLTFLYYIWYLYKYDHTSEIAPLITNWMIAQNRVVM